MKHSGRMLVTAAIAALLAGCSNSDGSDSESVEAVTGGGDTFPVEAGFIDPCQVSEDVLSELGVAQFVEIPMTGQDGDRERGCMGVLSGATADAPATIWFQSWAADVSFIADRWSDAEPIADLPKWRKISNAVANDDNLGCELLYKSGTAGYFAVIDDYGDADECSVPLGIVPAIEPTLPE